MRILVFQHLDVEHPGTFRDFWARDGHEWHAVDFGAGGTIPDLRPYDLLVVMGGPMDVWQEDEHPWLVPEKTAIRRWVREMGRPYLGVCLGHQLLADALGGTVGPMRRPEVGLASVELTDAGRRDPLLGTVPDSMDVFQWHGAEVTRLPDGAHMLAGNDACPVQAMRWGRHAYGFQFHPEISDVTIEDWERIPEYKASLEKVLGKQKADELAGLVRPLLPDFRRAADRLNCNLMGAIGAALRTA